MAEIEPERELIPIIIRFTSSMDGRMEDWKDER